jgi:hypothetical protein
MSSSENHSQDKTPRTFSERNVMSPVKGNPFHNHLKFKVSFRRTKETEMLAGNVSSQKALTPRWGPWVVVTCTTLLSVSFISHSEFPAILFSTRFLTWYYFLCIRKSRANSPSFYLRPWFSCLLLPSTALFLCLHSPK